MTDIDQSTALALLHEGLAIIPTAGGDEKRPFGQWKEYQGRLPSEDEVRGWFLSPRPGGIVCGAVSGGLEVIDLDTKESFAAFTARFGGDVPCEASPHGGHAWYRCDEIGRNGKPADKVDTRGEGGFCVVYEPQVLLAQGIPRIAREKRAELFAGVSGEAGSSGQPVKAGQPGASTIRETLLAQGWKTLGVRGNREDFSRPGAAHPTKCDASLFDGASLKIWSTAAQEAAPAARPSVVSAAELAARNPQLGEAVLPFCRRGSFALLAGDPKAGKTTFALKMCAKKAGEGLTCLYADFENGPALFWHRLSALGGAEGYGNIRYLDCRDAPGIDAIAAAMREIGNVDLLVIDCWGLLVGGDGVEDESSNALVSQYFLRVRRALAEFGCATVILHHTPKSGANEKLCFAGAGASSLQRYVQSICRIREDKNGAFWFEALCREFDALFRPVRLRRAG